MDSMSSIAVQGAITNFGCQGVPCSNSGNCIRVCGEVRVLNNGLGFSVKQFYGLGGQGRPDTL